MSGTLEVGKLCEGYWESVKEDVEWEVRKEENLVPAELDYIIQATA